MKDREFFRKLSNISGDVMSNKYEQPKTKEIRLLETVNGNWQLEYVKEDGNKITKPGTLKDMIKILSEFEKQQQ